MFVRGKSFQLSLLFACKAFHSTEGSWALTLPTNIRQALKGIPGTNTLAYCDHSYILSVKSFITSGPGPFCHCCTMNIFFLLSLMLWTNKLVCLSPVSHMAKSIYLQWGIKMGHCKGLHSGKLHSHLKRLARDKHDSLFAGSFSYEYISFTILDLSVLQDCTLRVVSEPGLQILD